MGVRIPGIPGTPPGGQIGLIIPAPPLDGGCTCKDVTLRWAVPDDDDSSSTQSKTSCPAVFSADGTICPSTEWSFDVTWDGDSGHVPTIVQIGAAAWKVVATAAGTFTVTASMQCGGVAAAMPKLTAVISSGGGGGVAEWQNLKDIATVVANPDMHGEACTYDSGTGVYSMAQGTGDYGDYSDFDITVDSGSLPVCVRIVILSGSVESENMATGNFNNTGNARGFYIMGFSSGSAGFNQNFSIFESDGTIRLSWAFQHGGDYTPTTFRIDYIATDS
jgi:hypothetical protein